MKTLRPLLLSVVSAFLVAGCASTKPSESPQAARVGFDPQPEGPVLKALKATGEGAVVKPTRTKDVFEIVFPASQSNSSALLSFGDTDINDRVGLAIDVRNRGRQPVRVYADLNGDTWVRGFVNVAPGKTDTLYVFERRKKLSAEALERFPGMHGIPGGKMSLWAGIEEPIIANDLKIFVVRPSAEAKIEVSNLRPFGSSKIPEAAGYFPFIDRYGQFKHKDWLGKTHSDADFANAKQVEDHDLDSHPGAKELDQYGGWAAGPELKKTGHFRTEKFQGKWWLVDPDGHLFWSNGIDMAGFNQSLTRTTGREQFYEDPAPMGNFLARNLQTKFGDQWRDLAADRLLQRVHSWGLNTLGGGAERAITAKRKVPYTVLLNSGMRGTEIDPESPTWKQAMRRSLTAGADRIKDDPWCIGFFVDNEIHASGDPVWWESYYKQVSLVVKELMPNKLYLGSRLDYHDWPDVVDARKEIVRLAAKYCDVVSFNFYKFTLDDVSLPTGIDHPAIIGEFHFGALDRGQFHTGLRSVADQNHRAEAYRNYVTSAAQNPAIVGAHWFQCYDESTTGRFDGENYQIGFIDICDTPYVETVAAAREVGYKIYPLRIGAK